MKSRLMLLLCFYGLIILPAHAQIEDNEAAVHELQELGHKRQKFVNDLKSMQLQEQIKEAHAKNEEPPESTLPKLDPELIAFIKKHQEKLQELQSNPYVQGVQRKLASPEVQAPLKKLITTSDWAQFGLWQLALFIVYIVFKARMKSRKEHWLGRLWTGAWCLALYLSMSLFLLPRFSLGPNYFELVGALIHG